MSRLHADDGLTFAELAVVTALLAVIIGIAYAGMQVAQRGSEVAQREAFFANEIATPMQIADKLLTQNLAIDDGSITGTKPPTRYYLSFLTDQNNDNALERHVLEAVAGTGDTGKLIHREYRTDNTRRNVALVVEQTWSTSNVNQYTGTPLFTYYSDSDRTTITDMAQVPANTRLVDVTITARFRVRAQDTGSVIKENRVITFRRKLGQ